MTEAVLYFLFERTLTASLLIVALLVTTYIIILNKGFFNRLRQSSLELKSEQMSFYEELCRQVKIKTPLPVILSDKLPSPCLVGLFHPRIAVTPEYPQKPLYQHLMNRAQ